MSGNTCEATAPRPANRRRRSPRDGGTAPSRSTPHNATGRGSGDVSVSSPSRKSAMRRETWGSRRSSVVERAGLGGERSRRRSGGQSLEKRCRHSPTRFEIDGGVGARQQRHTGEKVRAVILPVGNAGVEDIDPGRRAIDLRGEVGERPEVRMRLQPQIRSHRLNVPRWAVASREDGHQTGREAEEEDRRGDQADRHAPLDDRRHIALRCAPGHPAPEASSRR